MQHLQVTNVEGMEQLILYLAICVCVCVCNTHVLKLSQYHILLLSIFIHYPCYSSKVTNHSSSDHKCPVSPNARRIIPTMAMMTTPVIPRHRHRAASSLIFTDMIRIQPVTRRQKTYRDVVSYCLCLVSLQRSVIKPLISTSSSSPSC